jgi:[ribosomal protein S5]-alanine N-acetyltransferase
MKTLLTKRLVLRSLKESDLDAFYAYCKKENIGPNAGWKPHESIQESYTILRYMISENEVWGIQLINHDQLIGTIGLHDRKLGAKTRELGYVLDDTYWGQGYMVEAVHALLEHAFYQLGFDQIVCGHAVDNIKSKRVIEKTGFQYTHLEKRKHYDQSDIVIAMYQITKDEFIGGRDGTFSNKI